MTRTVRARARASVDEASIGESPTESGVAEPAREATSEPQRELQPGEVLGRDGEVLSRKRSSTTDIFFVPPHLKDPKYDYNWKTETVYNQPQIAHMVAIAENGWRAVLTRPGSKWSGVFMPNDYEGPIKRNGLVLMERPMALSIEAKMEEDKKARDQVRMSAEARGMNFSVPEGYSKTNPVLTAWQQDKTRQTIEPGPPQSKHQTATQID